MHPQLFCGMNSPIFWHWDWENNVCARAVFVDALLPVSLAFIAWRYIPSVYYPKVLTVSDGIYGGNGSDNRLWIGPLVTVLIGVRVFSQLVLLYHYYGANVTTYANMVSAVIILVAWLFALFRAASEWKSYSRYDKRRYFRLFSPAIMIFVAGCLGADLIQLYFMFFVRAQWQTPFWGSKAPKDAPWLMFRAAVDTVIIALFLIVRSLPGQSSPIFLAESISEAETTPAETSSQHTRRLTRLSIHQQQSPDIGCSILEGTLFSWVNPFVALTQIRQPEIVDLYAPPKKYTISECWHRFKTCHRSDQSLWWNLVRTYKTEIVTQLLLNPFSAVLELMQPFLMQRLLQFIESYSQNHIGLRYGFLLASLMMCTGLLMYHLEQQLRWHSRSLTMYMRNVLVTLLTQKTLCQKSNAPTTTSTRDVGESVDRDLTENQSDGKIYNILTADLGRLDKLSMVIQVGLIVPAQQIGGAWYMYRLLGISGIVGTSLLVLVVYLMRRLVAKANSMESELGLLNDQRLAVIGELVQGIMPIKLFGWGSRFIDIVGEKRANQLLLLWRRAKVWCWINLWAMGSLPIISFVSFILYSIGHDLEASTVFAAISVFKIIQSSVDAIPPLTAEAVSIFVSLKRLFSYLEQPEAQPLEERVHFDSTDDGDYVGFKDATLSWETLPRSGRFVLKNLDVNFPKGKLSIVGGPTGCGKSSMLSALVGEMQLTSGRILIPTTALTDESVHLGSFSRINLTGISYVAQEPWLCNATIRENILFGEQYDSSRYAKVLYACALVPDLLVLPAGDMSEIGERGITLSGGQKQRVALARAVYSSSSVLLIDDCLSAVDSHTAKHILHKCLLNADDLMRDRTRILVTHHMSMCLPYCDFVVLLDDGTINFQGSPHNLDDDAADVYNTDSDLESSETNSPHGMPLLPSEVSTALSKTPAATENAPETAPFSETASPTDGKLIDDEVRIHGMVKMSAWKTYFAPCGGWYFALTCIFSLLGAQVLAIYRDYYLASRLDIADSSPSHILAIYLLIGFVAALISSATFLFMYLRSLRASKLFHELLLKSIVYATPRFLETTPIGRIMTRFSKDIQIIDEDIIEILYYFLRAIIAVGLTLLVISSATPLFIVAGTIAMTIYVRVSWRYIVGTRETKRLEATSNAPMLSLFSEIIPGGKTIRSFGMQQAYMVEMERRFMEYVSADMMMRVYQRWIGIRLGIVSSTITFFTAILILMDIDHFSSGLAGFTLIYAIQLLSDSESAIRKYSSLELSINSVERAHQYMTIAQEAPAKTSAELRQVLQSKNWPQSGDLVVKDLVAGYTADRAVLHGISFHVRHGEKIGIVGRTGAGKSTLTLALLRIVEPISGCIELDGTDISSVGLEDLRKNITTIPQDPALFNGTVRFNLDPFGDYTDMELVGVLRRTLLLRPAPTAAFDSLDDEITSHGQNLSLGQRQLVALARALVRKSRLVVMDEATASVDFETDKEMQRIIRGPEFANSTVLCIAHRLRTVIDYDRVLVLDNGRIVEVDSPANLLNNTSSMFRQMCVDSGELGHLEKAAVDNLS